jgi:hypothetical protein
MACARSSVRSTRGFVSSGSKCEELSVSKSSPQCPIKTDLNKACQHFADGPKAAIQSRCDFCPASPKQPTL